VCVNYVEKFKYETEMLSYRAQAERSSPRFLHGFEVRFGFGLPYRETSIYIIEMDASHRVKL
jgi:hypothetical protein